VDCRHGRKDGRHLLLEPAHQRNDNGRGAEADGWAQKLAPGASLHSSSLAAFAPVHQTLTRPGRGVGMYRLPPGYVEQGPPSFLGSLGGMFIYGAGITMGSLASGASPHGAPQPARAGGCSRRREPDWKLTRRARREQVLRLLARLGACSSSPRDIGRAEGRA
jgi:hypothetical protein